MKNIIQVTWKDSAGEVFRRDYFSGNIDPLNILEHCVQLKAIYHHVIVAESCGEEYIMFNDGTRVELTMHELQGLKHGHKRLNRSSLQSAG